VFLEQTATFVLYNISSLVFITVFTARYELSPYITQIRFDLKGLNESCLCKFFFICIKSTIGVECIHELISWQESFFL
jgi:hypothetical protein